MAEIRPFCCIRPRADVAARVAALPYDVYDRQEAREVAGAEPLSFLNIDRPETQFADSYDMYAPEVYARAGEMLQEWIADGTLMEDGERAYYLYELTWQGRSQTGIVGCASVDDYGSGVIRRHENTREEKEQDRIRHIRACGAQTGPIYLSFRLEGGRSSSRLEGMPLRELIAREKENPPLYSFAAKNGVLHQVWKVGDEERVRAFYEALRRIGRLYIADGHHRAASAVKVGLAKREENPGHTGEEEYNYFLSVLFPEEELQILPYYRTVEGWNGHTAAEILRLVGEWFEVEPCRQGAAPYQPEEKGVFGLYLDGNWYELRPNGRLMGELGAETDPVKLLDVSVLQEKVLDPIFGIQDPRTDARIRFVGGIKGASGLQQEAQKLERRAAGDVGGAVPVAAFSVYPTSMGELLDVADEGRLMPPKSTWFEPKLLSGLFIHRL